MKEKEYIKGGKAANKSVTDLEKKWKRPLDKEIKMGLGVEREHSPDPKVAKEISKDHLDEFPDYYTRLDKMEKSAKKAKPKKEVKEMDAGSSGAYDAPAFGATILKKDIYKPKEQDIDEVTDSGSSGQFDVPLFGGTKGRKNPLSIGGEGTIAARSNTINKTKSFPKFGGPDAKFVTINPKCKKFPYCNQGDPKAISIHEDIQLMESIKEVSKKYGITEKELEGIVINEIKQIFI